jgi:tetratricopeptide (TPR) repeat protein
MRCSASFSPPTFALLFAIFISCLTFVNEAASENPRTEERFTAAQAREMVLTRAEGSEQIDNELRIRQQKAAAAPTAEAPWQMLGELFIAKARLSGDSGFYKLADLSSRVLESVASDPSEALLLRGHAWLAMHRFRDVESLARRLTKHREQMRDHALLGDALIDQGRIAEAEVAYQRMIDLKPCLSSYSRIAHLRWIVGDREGAIEMFRLAIACGNYRDPEPLAWATTRLALLELQRGNIDAARTCTLRAQELVNDFPAALVAEARVLLAEDHVADAISKLERAVNFSPLPETQWLLADALRVAGRNSDAAAAEVRLQREGATQDPRTHSLFLATRGYDAAKALQLAEAELDARQDVLSYDALAWAQSAAGDMASARRNSKCALAAGTEDARLFLHAGLIARAAGESDEATAFFVKAHAIQATLFPSERQALQGALNSAKPISAAPINK